MNLNVPLVGVIFDSEGDFGLSLYDDTESRSFYKKVALKNNVFKSYNSKDIGKIRRDWVTSVGVIFDSGGDFGLSLYDDTESISFYKKVALKNNVYKSYLVLKSKKC